MAATLGGETTRRALAAEFVHPGASSGVLSRQMLAIAAIAAVVTFAELAIRQLGRDAQVLNAAAWACVLAGSVAGAVYHPLRRFWWRGSLAGIVSSVGGLAAFDQYSLWRARPFAIEFAVVALLGSLPGVTLYWFLMRRQRVTGHGHSDEHLRRAVEQQDEADEARDR